MFMTVPKQRPFLTLFPAVFISLFFASAQAYGAAKIMPLGDSITYGVGATSNNGYRKPLYLYLTAAGYQMDFVGSQTNGNFADPQHEGHPGWHAEEDGTVNDINDQVYGWLEDNPADIVLLHIGTNDITVDGQDANEVSDILDEIDRYSEDITVILALIINRRSDVDPGKRLATTQFNQDVNDMAQNRITAGDDIIIVNMENALDYNVVVGDMYDQLHPKDSGYAKMAQCWFNVFAEYYIPKKTLTTSSGTGGSVTTPGEGSYQYNHGTEVELVATADLSYYFKNWTGTGASAGKIANPSSATTTITMDANYTAIANFSEELLTLTTSSTAGGSVTNPGEGQFHYDYGTDVNLVATADTDYYFVSWTGTGVNAGKVANPASATTTITMDSNYTAVANFDANCIKTLYLDGTLISSLVATKGLSWPSNRLTIGAEGTRGYLYNEYIGDMDDFAIYDGILDAADVVAHYAARTNYDTYKTVIGNDKPLLWLKFDDPCLAHNAIATNSGSVDIDGQYVVTGVECSPFTAVTGFHADSNAIHFPDTGVEPNGHCVDVWDGDGDLGENLEGDVTIELWVKFTDIGSVSENGYPRLFQHNGNWKDANGYGFMVDTSNVVGVMGGGDTDHKLLPYNINDNNWHHIVVTYESSYDELNTLSYVEEVAKDNPVLYLQFESDDPCDSSGNNYWVEYSPQVTIGTVPGSYGKCAFLGSGFIAAANQQTEPSNDPCYGPEYAFGKGNDLTVEMWLYYPDGVGTWDGLWNQNDKEDVNEWSPGCETGLDQCRMKCNENRTGGDGYAYTEDGAWAPDANNWHHHVMIYDASDSPAQITVQWWVDSVNYKNKTYNTSVFDNHIGPVRDHILFGNIGSRFAPGNGAYGQYMDEIAVYDHPLTQLRIDAHYKAFYAKTCAEMWARNLVPVQAPWAVAIDRNHDCKINFYDFAIFAQDWALCNDPAIGPPDCPPNW
jgi:lysophospholipase L1-like esterase